MNNIVYLSIYQPPKDHEFTHHDLFNTGKLSGMLGHGIKNNTFKVGSRVLVISKSSDKEDLDSINLACVRVKNETSCNPWKSYGEYKCYDVEFLYSKTIKYDCEDNTKHYGRVYDLARSIGITHQNSNKVRELYLYMCLTGDS